LRGEEPVLICLLALLRRNFPKRSSHVLPDQYTDPAEANKFFVITGIRSESGHSCPEASKEVVTIPAILQITKFIS